MAVAYRLASYATPLRALPSRVPARFHRGDEVTPTQYLCLHPLGPFAELMRGHDLRNAGQVAQVRARTWALVVELDGLLRIGFDVAEEHGIRPGGLVGDNHRPCQALADRLRLAGVPGIVTPSAALPGTENVVLFGPRVGSPYLLPPLGAVDVPASVTAETGRPLVGLLERVRYRRRPHPALQAWRRGRAFELDEPDWSLEGP